jgi:hypothetical protein
MDDTRWRRSWDLVGGAGKREGSYDRLSCAGFGFVTGLYGREGTSKVEQIGATCRDLGIRVWYDGKRVRREQVLGATHVTEASRVTPRWYHDSFSRACPSGMAIRSIITEYGNLGWATRNDEIFRMRARCVRFDKWLTAYELGPDDEALITLAGQIHDNWSYYGKVRTEQACPRGAFISDIDTWNNGDRLVGAAFQCRSAGGL